MNSSTSFGALDLLLKNNKMHHTAAWPEGMATF